MSRFTIDFDFVRLFIGGLLIGLISVGFWILVMIFTDIGIMVWGSMLIAMLLIIGIWIAIFMVGFSINSMIKSEKRRIQ